MTAVATPVRTSPAAPAPARRTPIDALAGWLARNSIALLRIAMGMVFFGFGVLKFFPGVSPAEELVTRTFDILTFGMVTGQSAMIATAIPECLIGISLITGVFLRAGVALLFVCLAGIMSPLVLLFGELFPAGGPTLEAQYVLKDVVLVAAGLVIAAKALGARMVVPTDRVESQR